MTKQHFLLTLTMLIVFFHSGTAIECYECKSDDNPQCGDPFDSKDLTSVLCAFPDLVEQESLEIQGFRNVCIKVQREVNGKIEILRECGYDSERAHLCEHLKVSPQVTHCSICEEDLCNGTPKQINIQSLTSYFVITYILGTIWTRISS